MFILQKFVQIINGDDMFKNYRFKDDILYIEIDIKYEFGNFSKNRKNIIDEIKDYIDRMKINLKKNKIVLTCSGIIIGSILLTNINTPINKQKIKYIPSFQNNITYVIKQAENINNIKKSNTIINEINENKIQNTQIKTNDNKNQITTPSTENNKSDINIHQNNNEYTSNDQNINNTQLSNQNNSNNSNTIMPDVQTVTIHRSNGSVIKIDLEEYVIGVVAAEMPASFNQEALKSQSIVARTYALKAKSTEKTLTDNENTQSYIDTNQMMSKWGSSYNTYYNKIKNAVENTKGEYLTYNGNYIEALYHSTSNGKTESSLDVFGNYYPYLISVSSEYDKSASSYLKNITIDLNTISSKLGINLTNDSIIEVLSYTDGSNIKEINIAGTTFSGKKVRETLGLRSTDFDMVIKENSVNITTRGYGHGVGMSQYGANGMANAGYDYKSILSHYYPGTILKK